MKAVLVIIVVFTTMTALDTRLIKDMCEGATVDRVVEKMKKEGQS